MVPKQCCLFVVLWLNCGRFSGEIKLLLLVFQNEIIQSYFQVYDQTLIFFNSHSGGGVHTGSIRHIGHFWAIVFVPGDSEAEEFGGMKIGKRNRSIRRKPALVPIRPPQIPLDQTRTRTWATAVGSQRLTAWAMARPDQTLRSLPVGTYCQISVKFSSRVRFI
jgi:hypothetical protein